MHPCINCIQFDDDEQYCRLGHDGPCELFNIRECEGCAYFKFGASINMGVCVVHKRSRRPYEICEDWKLLGS